VALFEPDEQVRWGLVRWLNQLANYECAVATDSAAAFLKTVARMRPELALFNDPPCTPASEHIQEKLARESPGQVGFPYGIYADSDHAWQGVTGVDGGYYYRRRQATQILDPISGLWQMQTPSRDAVETQLRHHIQTLFGLRAVPEVAFPGLTKRERDVLLGLRRGHTDKTLATMLGISSWTVHTHMKSLFDKLGVHTRAEAVAKFFEK
jgi:DNA-binding NarL/FixJ family response regulator